VQTIGRAARNVNGRVIMYANEETGSMKRAIGETNRRRKKQIAFNKEHNITPRTVEKAIREIERAMPNSRQARYRAVERAAEEAVDYGKLEVSIRDLRKKMNAAAEKMEFEEAAIYRDRLKALERIQIEQGV
jgi:excinuclease ABC subunit B